MSELEGQITNVQYYPWALSPSEIKASYDGDVSAALRAARKRAIEQCATIADMIASENGVAGASAQLAANAIRKLPF